jgi:hypothetical protein
MADCEYGRVAGKTGPDAGGGESLEPVGRFLGAVVASAFGLGAEAMRTGNRGRAEVAFARQVAMYLAHTRLCIPYTATGKLFGRDRTTARHACRQVEDRREDPRVDSIVDCLERAIDLSPNLARYLEPRHGRTG